MPIGALGQPPAPLQAVPRGSRRRGLRVQIGAGVGSFMARILSVGANQVGAMSAASGQTLSVPIAITNDSSAAIVVNPTALLFAASGTPGAQGQVNIGGTVYPITGYLSVGSQPSPSATLAAGASQTFSFSLAGLPASSVAQGVFVAVSATSGGQALPGSPLFAWTNPFLTVGATGGSSAFTFGSAANSQLSPGGMLQMEGASVTAAGDWWTLAISAVVGGQVQQTATLTGQGPASGLSYQIGPLNTPGAVALSGWLALYNSGAKSTQMPGSPVHLSTGVVANVAAEQVQVGAIGSVSVSMAADTANLSWSPAPNATSTEIQLCTSGGTPLPKSSQPSWQGTNGQLAADPTGSVGFFASGSSASAVFPAGTTTYVRLRGAAGTGPGATVGPWSGLTAITTAPGVPNIVAVGAICQLTASANADNSGVPLPLATCGVTQQNTGTANGTTASWTGVLVGPGNFIWQTFGAQPDVNLAPGDQFPQSYAQVVGYGDAPPPVGTYTFYAVLGSGYGAYRPGGFQILQSVLPGSVSASASTPGGVA